MILIWGSRIKETILGYFKEVFHCNHCNNASNFKVFVRRKWFTVFWIPLFPIETEYYMCCPICGYGRTLLKADVLKMQEDNVLGMNETVTGIE